MLRNFLFPIAALLALVALGCDPEVRIDDPESAVVSKDWSDTDIRTAANTLGQDLAGSKVISSASKPPVILPLRIKNKTSKHLNTSIILSQIETAVLKTGAARFVAGEAREALAKEYEYMASGMVNPATAKGPGNQTGCDYVLLGTIENLEARSVDRKHYYDYYYIKLSLIDVSTSEKVWQGEQETKKRVRMR